MGPGEMRRGSSWRGREGIQGPEKSLGAKWARWEMKRMGG